MSEKRLICLCNQISTNYETVYEDLSNEDWEHLKNEEEKQRTVIMRLLDE